MYEFDIRCQNRDFKNAHACRRLGPSFAGNGAVTFDIQNNAQDEKGE